MFLDESALDEIEEIKVTSKFSKRHLYYNSLLEIISYLSNQVLAHLQRYPILIQNHLLLVKFMIKMMMIYQLFVVLVPSEPLPQVVRECWLSKESYS
jgi:hypothetical protein